MPYAVDFKELKAKVSIEQVGEMLGLDMKISGNQFRGTCPACQGGGPRALAITPSKGVFFCFSAKEGGDCIKLVAHLRGINQKDAAQEIAEHFRLVEPSSREQSPRNRSPSPSEPHQDGFGPLAYLEHDHPAVDAVGLSAGDAKALGIGYAPRGLMKGLVAVPVRLEDGTLAGYLGIEEARLPKVWHLEQKVVPFQKKSA